MEMLESLLSQLPVGAARANAVFHLSFNKELVIPKLYLLEAINYYERKGIMGARLIAENASLFDELIRLNFNKKNYFDCAVIAEKQGMFEEAENYSILWAEQFIEEGKELMGASYAGNHNFEKAKKKFYRVLLKKARMKKEYEEAAYYAEKLGLKQNAKKLLKLELNHKENMGYYDDAALAAEKLGMKEKEQELILKQIDKYVRSKRFDQALNLCEKKGLEEKACEVKLDQMKDNILNNNYSKAVGIAESLGLKEKAEELTLMELEHCEKTEYYYRAINISKKLELAEKTSELYSKWIEKEKNSGNEKKYFNASRIAFEAGFQEQAKELLLLSIKDAELDKFTEIASHCEKLGMIKESDLFNELNNLSKK